VYCHRCETKASIPLAHGNQLEEILHLPPEMIARAGECDEVAMRTCDEQRFKNGKRTSSEQRPSMGQDMQEGRRSSSSTDSWCVRGRRVVSRAAPMQC
jgi:hypothetical protein